MKRKGLTPEGRRKLSEAALRNRPWEKSTGPRTEEGKARSALNGAYNQTSSISIREMHQKVHDVEVSVQELAELRRRLDRGDY